MEESLSELLQCLHDACSLDTFFEVKDRICFTDRPSVCKYLRYLDRGSSCLSVRSHGDYIRGVCNKGNRCPFSILFTRRGRIGNLVDVYSL